MVLKPEEVKLDRMENFLGGEKHLEARIFFDGTNKILTRAKLVPGASIGVHTHDGSSEVIFILQGSGVTIEDGVRKPVLAGDCLYCPKGCSHCLINDSDTDLIFCAYVPKQ